MLSTTENSYDTSTTTTCKNNSGIRHTGVVFNDRKILQGFEIDIVVPHLGVAFEYNGDYWHSDAKLLTSYSVFRSQ